MNELQQLYDTLVREGKYTRSFDEFQQRFNQDEAYRNKVYGVVTRDGIYTKDKDSFLKEYGAPVVTAQTPAAQAPAAQAPTSQDVKKKDDTTALPSGVGSSVSPKSVEEKDYFTGAFGDFLRGFDEFTGTGLGDVADDIARSWVAGYRQGDLAQASNKIIRSGNEFTDEDIQKLIDKSKTVDELGSSKEFQDYLKTYEQEGKSIWGAVKGLMENPTVFPEVMISSLVGMATNRDAVLAGTGVLAAAFGTGAATGGTAGTFVVPGIGTAVGAGAAGLSAAASAVPFAFGAASSVAETGSVFAQYLQEELGTDENGNPIKPTKENVRAILEDPEKYQKIKNDAIARGLTVGVIDAVGGKLATSVGGKIIKESAKATGRATKTGVVKALGAGGLIEGTAGSTGEVLGQVVVGRPIDKGNAVLEFMAEMPGAVRTTLMASLKTPTYKINGGKVSAEEIDTTIATMTPEQLAASDIEIYNDYDGRKEKLQDKIVTGAIANEIREAQPDLNEPTVNAIVALQKELNKLEGNKTQVAKDRAAVLRARIKELQENPLPDAPAQKQAAGQVQTETKEDAEKRKARIIELNDLLDLDFAITQETGQGNLSFDERQEIKQELLKLNAEEDAIQKQAAGQVSVQPTATVGQEVEGGTPQAEPQVVTEEGQVQEVISPSLQIEIDKINEERKRALEANRGGLDKPYYIGETEGPTLGEFINQEYDAKINELKAKDVAQAEPQGVTKENVKEKIAEVNNKSAELQKRQQLELEELNKKENKNYRDAFDILNVNEYSEDQSPRSQEAIDLANRHTQEFNESLQEKRNIESEAEKLNFSDYNLTDDNKLETLRGAINSVFETNKAALDEGFEASVTALDEANSVGANEYVAHGMGKTNLANAYNDLINLFKKGINPIRGRGSLDVAPLSGGVSTGTTASGNAYMDGPFTLVANRNHSGPITNINQIGGIIVNEGLATPEVLTSLRDLFPNLAIESTSNTKSLIEQLNAKPQAETAAPAPAKKGKAKPAPVAETVAPAAAPTAQPSTAQITIADVKVDFNPDNAIEVQKGTREDTRGGKVFYNAAVTSNATDTEGNPIGIITKRSDGEGKLSFTLKDSQGRNINKGKAYPTQRDAVTALVEQVNRVRAKASPAPAPAPTAPVVEVAAPEPVVVAPAPTPEPEPILVDGQEAPVTVTVKEIKSNTPKFTRDNSIDYEESYKEDSMGREVPYISSLTVEALDIDGEPVGTITRLVDEDKNTSYTAEDVNGNQIKRGEEFSSETEAMQALADHVNKQRQKEFDKEKAKIIKAREKAETKAKLAEEKKAAKKAAKAKTPEVDTVINEETGTLESALNFLDSVDKTIAQTLRTRANDALLGIPLTVVQGIVKGLKVLVQGGMKLRDAIKQISAENNISQEKLKDLLDIASIQNEFNTLMNKVDDLIANQKSKGIDEKKIVSNLDKMVRDFYKDLDINDAQRKIMEREARARMGVEPRKAASIGRVLGVLKDIANVTREEKLKIISRIRELGRDVGKDLANEIRDMAESGKITVNQAASIIARTLNLNPLNEASISNFVDYMAKVFSKADYVGKMETALNQIKQAKKNIKTKIGVAQDLFEPLNQLLSINPTFIPLNQLEKYLGILEDFSARKAVLSIPDRVKVLKQVNEILDEINNERSSVDALADRFNNYENKVFNEDGSLNYAETIKSMIDKGSITVDESELMKKYKSEILPQVEKVDLTDEQIAADKKKQIEILKKLEVNNKEFPLPSRDEKEDAISLAKLIKQLSVEDLMNLSLTDLKNIIKVINNINNGYLPHYAKISIEKLESIKQGKILSGAIERAKPLAFSKLYARAKEKLSDSKLGKFKKSMDELIRGTPLYYIGDVFGDFKTKDIFNSLLEASAQALSTFNSELKRIDQKIEAAQNKVLASFNQNPDKYLMSKFRMTAYMLQREYESNIGKKGVKPVTEYLKATIKHIRMGNSMFNDIDADKLEQIVNEVESYTKDGKVDLDKFYNTFNNAEKNAIEVMTEINQSLGEKAAYTASVIRGNKVELMDNYFHHNVLHEQNPMEATAAPEFSENYKNSMKPSSKAKNLIERTGELTPLNFDLFTSTQKGAKFVLLDYNLTSPIRTARRTLLQAKKNLEAKGLMTKEKLKIFNAINNAYEEALENLLNNSIAQDPLANEVVDFIQKQGYRAALAGTVRFKAELASNIVNALIINPKGFARGLKNVKLIASANGFEFMKNVKSKQTSRLYASDALSGKMVDPQVLKQTSGIKGSVSRGALMNRTLQLYNLTLKKYVKNPVEFIADTMMSTPDKVVSMPLWFGSFMNEFKRITGEEVNQEMIINNDLDYMQKYEDAIEQATRKADQESVYSGASNNEFMGILKGKIKPNQALTQKVWNNFNSYMTNFMNFDYAAARSAVYNLFNQGYMTKQKAAAVLAGLVTRSVIYQVMVANMGAGIVGAAIGLAFDFEDEEEVDEKTYYQKLGRSLANVLVGYTVGRNFGNVVRGMINVGVEKINEEYLDFLRNGEYDFYKDNIAYTYLPVGETRDIDVGKTAIAMAGPYTPALNTVALVGKNIDAMYSRVTGQGSTKKEADAIRREDMTLNYRIPLEVAGQFGLVPFYKDVKKAVNDEIYKDLRKAASTPDSSIPSADEYEKLKDLRELKSKTSNKDELKEIDREIMKIVGSEESKESLEKIQEIKSEKKKRLLYDASKSIRYDNESDMKRLNPALWRKRFGPNSDWAKSNKASNSVDNKLEKLANKREDREFRKNKGR